MGNNEMHDAMKIALFQLMFPHTWLVVTLDHLSPSRSVATRINLVTLTPISLTSAPSYAHPQPNAESSPDATSSVHPRRISKSLLID